MVMGTNLSKLNAICPKCRMSVGLRPGKRLLKHGHSDNPYHPRPPCVLSGEKVTIADIIAWAEMNEVNHQRAMDAAQKETAYAEGRLKRAREDEQTAQEKLKAAREILAEYGAKVTT